MGELASWRWMGEGSGQEVAGWDNVICTAPPVWAVGLRSIPPDWSRRRWMDDWMGGLQMQKSEQEQHHSRSVASDSLAVRLVLSLGPLFSRGCSRGRSRLRGGGGPLKQPYLHWGGYRKTRRRQQQQEQQQQQKGIRIYKIKSKTQRSAL